MGFIERLVTRIANYFKRRRIARAAAICRDALQEKPEGGLFRFYLSSDNTLKEEIEKIAREQAERLLKLNLQMGTIAKGKKKK